VFIKYFLSEVLLSSRGMESICELKWLKQAGTCPYATVAICEQYFHTATSFKLETQRHFEGFYSCCFFHIFRLLTTSTTEHRGHILITKIRVNWLSLMIFFVSECRKGNNNNNNHSNR